MKKLEPMAYERVRPLIEAVPFNVLFAEMVMENRVEGDIFVDCTTRPSVCLIKHPYGLALLCGNSDNEGFNQCLKETTLLRLHDTPQSLMVYPGAWHRRIRTLVPPQQVFRQAASNNEGNHCGAEGLCEDARLHFSFRPDCYKPAPVPAIDFQVVQLGGSLYEYLDSGIVPKRFWKCYEDFARTGMGFCLTRGVAIVSTAFCAYRSGRLIELGVQTMPHYRSAGLGIHACAALIDRCIEMELEPIWSCSQSNTASVRLAEKLGFVASGAVPCYRLMHRS